MIDEPEPGWEHVDRLARAMGIVCLQADCTMDEALVMMTERATVHHCTVEEVAFGVLEGIVRFGP